MNQGCEDSRCLVWLRRALDAATRFEIVKLICQASLALCNQLIEESDFDDAQGCVFKY